MVTNNIEPVRPRTSGYKDCEERHTSRSKFNHSRNTKEGKITRIKPDHKN